MLSVTDEFKVRAILALKYLTGEILTENLKMPSKSENEKSENLLPSTHTQNFNLKVHAYCRTYQSQFVYAFTYHHEEIQLYLVMCLVHSCYYLASLYTCQEQLFLPIQRKPIQMFHIPDFFNIYFNPMFCVTSESEM